MERVPVRVQAAVYAAGLFSATMSNLMAVVVPLWLLVLDASPVMIGLAIGAFHLGSFFFSVHGGAMMDRLGARRVMVWFAGAGTAMPLLFPAMPWVGAVFVLQVLIGLFSTMGWVGAQTLIGTAMKGSAVYAGRFTFVGVIGNLVGPPLAGAGWDTFGPWGGFAVLSLWAACQLLATLALPRAVDAQSRDDSSVAERLNPPVTARIGWRDFVPKPESYFSAFGLLAIPTVAFVIMVSMLRISGHGIQGSFYVVYLDGIAVSGTAIGALLSAGAVAAMAGSLFAAPLARVIRSTSMQLVTSLASVLAIAVTPLLGVYILFMLAQLFRGVCVGLSTPLIISEMSAAVGRDQGKAVGLRTMSNRFMSAVTPMVMGGLVAVVGLEASFLIAGLISVAMALAILVFGRVKKVV